MARTQTISPSLPSFPTSLGLHSIRSVPGGGRETPINLRTLQRVSYRGSSKRACYNSMTFRPFSPSSPFAPRCPNEPCTATHTHSCTHTHTHRHTLLPLSPFNPFTPARPPIPLVPAGPVSPSKPRGPRGPCAVNIWAEAHAFTCDDTFSPSVPAGPVGPGRPGLPYTCTHLVMLQSTTPPKGLLTCSPGTPGVPCTPLKPLLP